MPTAALHSNYWATQGAPEPEPEINPSAAGGYAPWQAAISGLLTVLMLLMAR